MPPGWEGGNPIAAAAVMPRVLDRLTEVVVTEGVREQHVGPGFDPGLRQQRRQVPLHQPGLCLWYPRLLRSVLPEPDCRQRGHQIWP